jgi:hypothetical protein
MLVKQLQVWISGEPLAFSEDLVIAMAIGFPAANVVFSHLELAPKSL